MKNDVNKVCRHCGSEMVTRDALVSWNKSGQCWDIINILDSGDCAECGESGDAFNLIDDKPL